MKDGKKENLLGDEIKGKRREWEGIRRKGGK